MPDSPPLVLASTSRYRRELLGRFGLPFESVPPGVEETARAGERPGERALRLALEKAQAVSKLRPQALVIGSDQVCATADGTVLDKPGDAARTVAQLQRLSGGSATFHTGCAVLGRAGGVHLVHLDTTRVAFRVLEAAEIARYVAREQPYDCAGGFKAESLGIALFERLETSDPTALIGLPLIWLAGALRSAGLPLP
ncbi:MAG TPA: nucleoside triphosphate pyrophosphatase [Steroidobacteraceae bacterium]|nr:nucleoside triphosphate pyrophosphatase [Steroidobacteraceae bacterium]